ncbi:phosphotransferase family protein [Paenibacillus humicola]|uniref:phosphotransferase family protein n=1 Tax=Paenibacillus humicola TaxID=3110540 RepID=UPI00237A3CA6|nr:aminoglycoside phosphotransferase family protein [Paenibacillus humicola]
MRKKDPPQIEVVTQIAADCLKSATFRIERVLSGVSTYVYRIHAGGDTFYLRILPEPDNSFAAEVHVHALLGQNDVQVPEVVYFEPHHEAVGMSVMLVKEIPGSPVESCSSRGEYERVLAKAGKQLARINRIKVDGFGWVHLDKAASGPALRGEKRAWQDFVYEFLDGDLARLSDNLLASGDVSRIKSTLNDGAACMSRHEFRLNHGDFDDSHIFFRGGTFSGIIDFGEIQANSPLYDLGHYLLHDGRQMFSGFDALAKGYDEVSRLTHDDLHEIELWALWIGIRRLSIVSGRPWNDYHGHLTKSVKMIMDRLAKS